MVGKAGERRRHIWKYMLLGTVFLVAFVWIMLLLGDRMPEVKLPQPEPPPHPNAYDYYLRAENQLHEQVKKTTIAKELWEPTNYPELETLYSDKQKQVFLTQMAPCLHPIHEGFHYQCQVQNTNGLENTGYGNMRDLNRYLCFAARTEARVGKWDDTAQYALDSLRLGTDVMQHLPVRGALVGASIQSTCRTVMWSTIDHLSVAQARAAVTRLQEIDASTPSFAETLLREKDTGQIALYSLLHYPHPSWRLLLLQYYSFNEYGATGGGGMDGPLPLYTHGLLVSPFDRGPQFIILRSKRSLFSAYGHEMDRLIRIAVLKYQDQVSAILVKPGDTLALIFTPQFIKCNFKLTANQTQNRMLLVECALQAYHVEHGEYPQKLEALVPTYLTRLPDDPFALTGTFHYLRKGSSYLLYSVGPDGKDDGGKPVFDKTSSRTYYVQEKSTGDFVARVNE